MKRVIAAAAAATGLLAATLALAPAAHAGVTNPADNPHKITVKGDDGNTYVDGQDTLPGYDDEECTYIPGAYFDFDNNRVRYADGQSIPWTEWDRATGYKEWLAKKNSSSSTPKPSGTSSTKPSSGSTKKPTTTTKSGTTTKASTSKPASGTAVTPSADPTAAATTGAAADGSTPAAGATAAPGAPSASPTDVVTDDAAPTDEVALASGETNAAAADSTDAKSDSSGSSSAGLLILGGLAGAGLLTFAGYSVLGRKRKTAV